jgi:hypothetical protein
VTPAPAGPARSGRAGVTRAVFTAPADRRSVLDRAHRGDIVGALGRIPSHDTGPRRSRRGHAAALLAVMGPGVVVLVADNDAGGISTYAQAGQDYGLRFVWLLLVLAGALLVNQEGGWRIWYPERELMTRQQLLTWYARKGRMPR